MTSFKRGAAVDVDPVVLAVDGVGGGGTDGTVILNLSKPRLTAWWFDWRLKSALIVSYVCPFAKDIQSQSRCQPR